MSTEINAYPSGYSRIVIYDPINKRITYLDPLDGGILPVVDAKESMIHREAFFTAIIKEDNLKSSDKKYIYLKAPEGKTEIHLNGNISVSKTVSVDLYENPTIVNLGTSVEPFNNDRNSKRKPLLKVYEDSAQSDLGTSYLAAYVKDYGKPSDEIILKKGGGYLVEIKPKQNNTEVIVAFTWYEADR